MRSRRSIAGSALLIGFALCVAAPSAAQNGHYNGQCRKMTRQISHFQDVADMARARDDEMWLASTAAHIERLRDRRSRLCPQYDQFVERVRTEEFWRDTYALTIAGAKTAMRYFTFGMY
jgi:TolA-binding protein